MARNAGLPRRRPVRRHDSLLAGLPTPGVSLATLFMQGFDFVLGAMDVTLVREATCADVERPRAACKAKALTSRLAARRGGNR